MILMLTLVDPTPDLFNHQHIIIVHNYKNKFLFREINVSYLKLTVIMSEVENSEECDSESRDLYQGRTTQGTLSGGSPIRQTRAEIYSHSVRTGKDKGMSKGPGCSEDDEATLQKVKKPSRPLSPLIVQVNHSTRRDDYPLTMTSLSLLRQRMKLF